MDKPDDNKADGLKLLIDFDGAAEGTPVTHANHMVLQIQDHEVYLSFFQLSPPVVFGTAEEQIAKLTERGSIRPECIARINMSPRFLKKVFKVIKTNLEKYDPDEDEDDDEVF